MIYKNKNIIFYKGNWENNLKNGKGIMLIKNDNKYEGEWKNDILINGKIIFKNKDIYEGNLLNEIIEGKDKMKYLNENEKWRLDK